MEKKIAFHAYENPGKLAYRMNLYSEWRIDLDKSTLPRVASTGYRDSNHTTAGPGAMGE